MTKTEIEYWVLRILEQVENGQQIEDARVELKREWIEPKKAARRIAGHANAARREPILWIIGVDEKEGAKGASRNDLADWFSKVKACFADGIYPELTDIVVPIPAKGISVVALSFETDRPPYVVNGEGSSVDREVPWREGTKTRSAYRSDLLKILVEQQNIPQFEILNAEVTLVFSNEYHIELNIYIISAINKLVVIPFHRCRVWLEFSSEIVEQSKPVDSERIECPGFFELMVDKQADQRNASVTLQATETELVINGPGRFRLSTRGVTRGEQKTPEHLIVHVLFQLALSDVHVPVTIPVKWDGKHAYAGISKVWRA